jgi:hypothetical protein
MGLLEQILTSSLAAAVIGALGVIAGVAISALLEGQREKKRAQRDRVARREEYLRHRRDAFEGVLEDFVPVHDRWSRVLALSIRELYASMSDTDPMPDEVELDQLDLEVDRYIARLKVRSPSATLTEHVDTVASDRESVRLALNAVNHAALNGTDENQEEARQDFGDALDRLADAVAALVAANASDARG